MATGASASCGSSDRVTDLERATVGLYWIPLGAGGRSVRCNGIVYEALQAIVERRTRCDLYHSVLDLVLPDGRFMVEMTPVPDLDGDLRGVVAEGSVGMRAAGRLRIFRYEVRRWRDGVVPDLGFAVDSPQVLTTDPAIVQRVFDLLPAVPRLVWGRDESGAGEMWTCNSVTSWALAAAGIDLDGVAMPPHGRAPGWDAGITVARRHTEQHLRLEPSRRRRPASR